MSDYTIYAPGSWHYDIQPAMEDYEGELMEGTLSEGEAEVVKQYWDRDRTFKRGKGSLHRFDLTSIAAVKFLRDEAAYRFSYNRDLLTYGDAEGDERPYVRKCRDAAKALMERCDKAIQEVTA
jgi:hypothetical protein